MLTDFFLLTCNYELILDSYQNVICSSCDNLYTFF